MIAPNTVHCEDALVFLRGLDDASVDLIATDPPYNRTELAFECDIDWPTFWSEAARVLRSPHSPVVVFSQQPFTTDLINSNRPWYRDEIIYHKTMPTGHLNANRRPLRAHENIIVFAAAEPYYIPVMEDSTTPRATAKKRTSAAHYGAHDPIDWVDTGLRFPRSVWTFAQRTSAFKQTFTLHPTQKPVDLMMRLVMTYSPVGGLVVDPFCGSGSTAEASRACGRNFIVGDIDPHYVAVTNDRLRLPFSPRVERPSDLRGLPIFDFAEVAE